MLKLDAGVEVLELECLVLAEQIVLERRLEIPWPRNSNLRLQSAGGCSCETYIEVLVMF